MPFVNLRSRLGCPFRRPCGLHPDWESRFHTTSTASNKVFNWSTQLEHSAHCGYLYVADRHSVRAVNLVFYLLTPAYSISDYQIWHSFFIQSSFQSQVCMLKDKVSTWCSYETLRELNTLRTRLISFNISRGNIAIADSMVTMATMASPNVVYIRLLLDGEAVERSEQTGRLLNLATPRETTLPFEVEQIHDHEAVGMGVSVLQEAQQTAFRPIISFQNSLWLRKAISRPSCSHTNLNKTVLHVSRPWQVMITEWIH